MRTLTRILGAPTDMLIVGVLGIGSLSAIAAVAELAARRVIG